VYGCSKRGLQQGGATKAGDKDKEEVVLRLKFGLNSAAISSAFKSCFITNWFAKIICLILNKRVPNYLSQGVTI
jgi:hypothetical protein